MAATVPFTTLSQKSCTVIPALICSLGVSHRSSLHTVIRLHLLKKVSKDFGAYFKPQKVKVIITIKYNNSYSTETSKEVNGIPRKRNEQ